MTITNIMETAFARLTLKRVTNQHELEGIHRLLQQNLKSHLSTDEAMAEGFLTADYSMPFLQKLNEASASVIAKHDDLIIGYALAAVKEVREENALLADLFNGIDKLEYEGQQLKTSNYVVVGQLCVAKDYRGMGVIEKVFTTFNPSYPFDYNFVDQAYAKKFEDEKRTGSLAALFAGLTIFISCLGLFGLATYMAESRIKEIGVRKVLGASVSGITTLLSKDFLKLIIISFIIASPVAYWGMYKWLQEYTYRIDIEWWVFAIAGLLSVLIAVASVSYQAMRQPWQIQ